MSEANSSHSGGSQASFFKLYAVFSSIDSLASFMYGRRYALIKDFFNYYVCLAVSEDDKRLSDAKDKCKKNFRNYVAEHREDILNLFPNNIQHSHYLCLIQNNQNLSLAFKEFVDAVEQYEKWRSLLNEEQIRTIYKKNLEDRQKYYANDVSVFDKLNNKLIQSVRLDNNKILKQSLVEFHNAISHLVVIYYGQSESEKNIDRAINHFRRGALDSYKAIIKDFYHIRDSEIYDPLNELKEIREREYKNIGKDNSLCKSYKELTNKIIETYQ